MKEGRLETISMNFVKQKLMLFTVLVFKAASPAAVPIITDFAQQNQSIKKNDILQSREKVVAVKPFPNLEAYIQRILESNIAENVLTENTETNSDDIEGSSVSKVSKAVFENFQSVKYFAKKISQYDFGFLSLELQTDRVIKNYSEHRPVNYNKATSHLDIEPSGSLSNIVEKKVVTRASQQYTKKFDLEMLKNIMLDLFSPAPMFSLLAFAAVVSLSSKRSKNY